MRLILRHGTAWEADGVEGFHLDRDSHYAGLLRKVEGATRLCFCTTVYEERLATLRAGIFLASRTVSVTFLEEEV